MAALACNFCFKVSLYFMIFGRVIKGCTTLAVGSSATVDGSVMATHSNDGEGTTDPRLVRVPARDHNPGDERPIWESPETYPRYVGYERGPSIYFPENCQAGKYNCASFEPIGYIPQVNHTFAYFEQTYGTMNEKQVALSESTCSSVFVARALNKVGGGALLSIDQLSQIAMERASTAREAVQLMGALGEQYGFYGPSASFEGGAESLMVSDPKEAWVFHILADPTGTSAIWAAARVPDDSVAVVSSKKGGSNTTAFFVAATVLDIKHDPLLPATVHSLSCFHPFIHSSIHSYQVANMFSIREMDLADSANFLGRMDMWDLAEEQGLYTPGEPKDFTRTFSDGEYAHKYYSGRRMWGVFRLLAPDVDLPAEYDNLKNDKPYPFAVPVSKRVSTQDIMAVMRDWYEGTPYSTAEGIAGGDFATPDRFNPDAKDLSVEGSW